MFADDHPMYEIAGDLETANNNLIRNANNNTSGLYACNFQKGNFSKYQTMSLIHNSTVSDIPLHFQGNTIERVWMGEYKCQLSVKISAICQLSVKFLAFCQLPVKWILMINYEAYLYIFLC